MEDLSDKDVLIEVMSPLITPLYESLDRGLELAQQHFVDFDMTAREYLPGAHHLARAHSRRLLLKASAEERLGGWKVAKPNRNLQVLLYNEALKLRLLRPLGKDVPPPGRNRARRAYYSNVHDNLLGIRGSKLLGLWSVDPTTGEVWVRVVRPTGPWKWKAPARLDMDFILPRGIEDLQNLEFIPTETLEQGFLPFEEEDDQDGEEDVSED